MLLRSDTLPDGAAWCRENDSSEILTQRTSPKRLVTDQHAACCHELFHIAKAHAEPEVIPNALRNGFSREPMATVEIVRHSFSITSRQKRANGNGTSATFMTAAASKHDGLAR